MRKILSLFVVLIATNVLWAYDAVVGGIYYNLAGDSATVVAGSYSGSVVIPASVTYGSQVYRVTGIYSDAFRNCSTLTSITIPTSMKKIYEFAFDNCSSLDTIVWNAINCSTSSLSSSPFLGTPVSNLIFGLEVQYIQDYMFRGLVQLTSVTIPESVTSIGKYSFGSCRNLKSLSLPNSLKHIDNGAFEGCSGLTSLVIPDQVTTIGYMAFHGCDSLETLMIGNSVDSIGNEAFELCGKITTVTIPQSVRFVGTFAFAANLYLKYFEVKNPEAFCDYLVLANCVAIDTIIGPGSLFNFPVELMIYLDNQPYTASYIQVTGGELDETGCLSITHNYKRLKHLDAAAATNTTITDEAFMGCYNIETLKLPNQLQRVPYMAVAGCKFLKSIDIPASVVEIEPSAFEDCRSIQTITFGGVAKSPAHMAIDAISALKKIGNWAFYNAHELQNLTIPEGVEEIGDGAFYGCTYLEDLKLPSTVREIGDNCFALCSKLKKITVTSMTPPTIYAKTFYDVNRAIPVYVPDEAVDNYKNDTNWKEFDIRGGATPLDQLTASPVNQFTKIIKDGQLYILRDGKTYNAQGAEVR